MEKNDNVNTDNKKNASFFVDIIFLGFIFVIIWGLDWIVDYCIDSQYTIMLIPVTAILIIFIRFLLKISFIGFDPTKKRYRNKGMIMCDDPSIKDFAKDNGILDEYNAFGDFYIFDLFDEDY